MSKHTHLSFSDSPPPLFTPFSTSIAVLRANPGFEAHPLDLIFSSPEGRCHCPPPRVLPRWHHQILPFGPPVTAPRAGRPKTWTTKNDAHVPCRSRGPMATPPWPEAPPTPRTQPASEGTGAMGRWCQAGRSVHAETHGCGRASGVANLKIHARCGNAY